ncbi:MAG: hypothetical protein FWD35_02275 [Oscillospiraceae bacterium]|nr:hypothetical protein [Oscillospiraceae bacterium]
MGAAMAPAAYHTIKTHFANTGTSVAEFDCIVTGDLGRVGSAILCEMFEKDKIDLAAKHKDCGVMLYAPEQDTHAGGSGCGCSASVLCGYLLGEVAKHKLGSVLFVATGALMSPTMTQQGESIPGIAHAVHISAV